MAQDIVGSKLPANNGYGQNGYSGASSDTDLSNPTQSAAAKLFPVDLQGARDKAGLPEREPVKRAAPVDFKQPKFEAPQTRTVKADSYPLSFGMDKRSSRKS